MFSFRMFPDAQFAIHTRYITPDMEAFVAGTMTGHTHLGWAFFTERREALAYAEKFADQIDDLEERPSEVARPNPATARPLGDQSLTAILRDSSRRSMMVRP